MNRSCKHHSKMFKTIFLLLTASTALITSIFAKQPLSFEALYNYYFPKNSPHLTGDYRRGFDAMLSAPPKAGEDRHHFYYAFHGDRKAFRFFVHHADRSGSGEFALTWIKESLVLLLHLGDARFAALLGQQDTETRRIVGAAIEQQVDWRIHRFPKTRALYSNQYIPPPRPPKP
jgi:hypothetical protein